MTIEVKRADITKECVDAIVNAANRYMLGGGGVDGAIHDAAGPELVEACAKYPPDENGYRVQTGEAKITGAYRLPCKFVIHTAGPDCCELTDEAEQDRLLRNSYLNSLNLAKENGCKSVSFPSLSTGIFCFPLERATKIAADTICGFLKDNPDMSVRMCIFTPNPVMEKKIQDAYEKAFADASRAVEG